MNLSLITFYRQSKTTCSRRWKGDFCCWSVCSAELLKIVSAWMLSELTHASVFLCCSRSQNHALISALPPLGTQLRWRLISENCKIKTENLCTQVPSRLRWVEDTIRSFPTCTTLCPLWHQIIKDRKYCSHVKKIPRVQPHSPSAKHAFFLFPACLFSYSAFIPSRPSSETPVGPYRLIISCQHVSPAVLQCLMAELGLFVLYLWITGANVCRC